MDFSLNFCFPWVLAEIQGADYELHLVFLNAVH